MNLYLVSREPIVGVNPLISSAGGGLPASGAEVHCRSAGRWELGIGEEFIAKLVRSSKGRASNAVRRCQTNVGSRTSDSDFE
jgi:hypothetical protein